jgi:PST family polysaccharide transporter
MKFDLKNIRAKYLMNGTPIRRILINTSSLFSIQVISYLLPLITAPYLNRVLGLENIGVLSFTAAFIGYFTILTEFGFNITGIRLISINAESPKLISEIFCSITIIKSILFLLSLLILCFFTFHIKMFNDYNQIYFLSFGVILSNILISNWFYQGVQEMRFLTLYTLISKLIYTISIFIIINDRDDFYLVPLLNFITTLVVGIFSMIYIVRKYHINFFLPKFSTLKKYFLESYHVFISNIFISIYTISTTFILGLLTNYKEVGIYSSADKIVQIFKSLTTPISESIYPEVAKRFKKDLRFGLNFVLSASKVIIIFSFTISFLSFIFADKIIMMIFGSEFIDSIYLLKIMSFIPFCVSLSNLLGIQIMLNLNLKKEFTLIIFLVSVTSIFSNFLFVKAFKSIATSIIVQCSEFMIFALMFIVVYIKIKNKIKNTYEV